MTDVQEPQDQQSPEEVPQDSAPVDGTVSTNNPHPVAEDPEEHIGDEQKDPWDDEESDWKQEKAVDPETDADHDFTEEDKEDDA